MSDYLELSLLLPTAMSSHLATWKVNAEINSPFL